MSVKLERAVEPDEIIAGVKAYGVTQKDIAGATHVSQRAVHDWTHAKRATRSHSYDRLVEIRDIVLLLKQTLTTRGVGHWLHGRNRLLDNRRPWDVLTEGDYDAVRNAAQAFVEGAYV